MSNRIFYRELGAGKQRARKIVFRSLLGKPVGKGCRSRCNSGGREAGQDALRTALTAPPQSLQFRGA